jgi:hypothetical protein
MIHVEAAFEALCEATLLDGGYGSIYNVSFDSERATLSDDEPREGL